MPKLEEYFPPAFFRQRKDDSKFEVFVLNRDEGMYFSLGTYEHKETARIIVEGRTAGFASSNRISTDD